MFSSRSSYAPCAVTSGMSITSFILIWIFSNSASSRTCFFLQTRPIPLFMLFCDLSGRLHRSQSFTRHYLLHKIRCNPPNMVHSIFAISSKQFLAFLIKQVFAMCPSKFGEIPLVPRNIEAHHNFPVFVMLQPAGKSLKVFIPHLGLYCSFWLHVILGPLVMGRNRLLDFIQMGCQIVCKYRFICRFINNPPLDQHMCDPYGNLKMRHHFTFARVGCLYAPPLTWEY
jgi:hypothetical protein